MPKVIDITVLNIDEKPYAVESLTDEVKALVEIYNDWSRKEAEVKDELTRYSAAKETLSRQIITTVREHLEDKKAEAEKATEVASANDADLTESVAVLIEDDVIESE